MLDKAPPILVYVPTYNHFAFIRQCLDSIVSQKTTIPFTVLIIDDCSTDGTIEIIREYSMKYPHIINAVIREKNVGVVNGQPPELDEFAPKYFIMCEGDDFWSDDLKLQKQFDFMEAHPECSICFHPVRVFYEDNSRPDSLFPHPGHRIYKEKLTFEDLLKNNFIQTNTVLYRWRYGAGRKSFRDAFPKGILPGDWFIHLLHAEVGEIGFINEVMAAYRRHGGGVWSGSEGNPAFHVRNGQAILRFYYELENRFQVDRFSTKFEHFFAILASHAKLGNTKEIENIIYSPDYMTLLSPSNSALRDFTAKGALKDAFYYRFISFLAWIFRSRPRQFRHALRRSLKQCLFRRNYKRFSHLCHKYIASLNDEMVSWNTLWIEKG